MTSTPRKVLESRIGTMKDYVDKGTISQESLDVALSFAEAYDKENLMQNPPEGETSLKPGTLAVYMQRVTAAAKEVELADATARDINGILQSLSDKDASKWTIHGYSTAYKKFYGYHDFGPEKGEITKVDTPNHSTFTPDDMLTRDEIHDMMDSCSNPRDRAVFATLIYTGMRNNALRSLRVGDVDIENGVWTFNTDEIEGLKGAEKHGETRPLLGARGPIREWLNYHPASDDPEAYLITGRPKWGKCDPYNEIAGSTVRRILNDIVENTGNESISEKPTHPHMMRHNFVTICKRDYELPDETVKHLISHSPDSTVMETTYSHLSDSDHIERAEVAAGLRKPSDDNSPLTPAVCGVCGENLPKEAKACPACGTTYTPDANAVKNQVSERIYESKAEVESETREEGVDNARDIIENRPELAANVVEELMSDD